MVIGLTLEKDWISGGHGRLFAFKQYLLRVCVCERESGIFVCFYQRDRARCGWYYAHFRDSVVCKAVLVDIASMEERFLHSLRYTLINLLKPARPVSSSLTHQKSRAAQNVTRIFSMDASGKSFQPQN